MSNDYGFITSGPGVHTNVADDILVFGEGTTYEETERYYVVALMELCTSTRTSSSILTSSNSK